MNDEVEELEVIIKKIKYKGIIWIPQQTSDGIIKNNPKKQMIHIAKKPYVVKWVKQKQVGDIFTKDEFYKLYPKHKKDITCRRRVDEAIQNMILERHIEMWEILGQYKVLKL